MAFLLTAGLGPAMLKTAAAATPRAGEVRISLDQARGGCHVRGDFHAPVSVTIAWQVLTDYDGIAGFVRSVRESRLEQGPDGRRRLRQDAVGSGFMIQRRVGVLLELGEPTGRRRRCRAALGEGVRADARE